VPGSWIVSRATRDGGRRYLVRYRLGGRESAQRYAGSFRTRAEALERRRWVDGELAAMRVPNLSTLDCQPVRAPALADAVAAYRASRIDIAEATRVNIGTSLNLIAAALDAGRPLDAFASQEIADAVARLHASGYKRETIRKAVTHLACVFDFAEVEPNPVRDKLRVRLPRGELRARAAERRSRRGRLLAAAIEASARPALARLVGRPGLEHRHDNGRRLRRAAPTRPPSRRCLQDRARPLGRPPGRAR
jgi:hypothetical protein